MFICLSWGISVLVLCDFVLLGLVSLANVVDYILACDLCVGDSFCLFVCLLYFVMVYYVAFLFVLGLNWLGILVYGDGLFTCVLVVLDIVCVCSLC